MKSLLLLVVLFSTGWWILDTYQQQEEKSKQETYAISADSKTPAEVPLRVQYLNEEISSAKQQVKQAVTDYFLWGIGIIGLILGLLFAQMSYHSISNFFKL